MTRALLAATQSKLQSDQSSDNSIKLMANEDLYLDDNHVKGW